MVQGGGRAKYALGCGPAGGVVDPGRMSGAKRPGVLKDIGNSQSSTRKPVKVHFSRGGDGGDPVLGSRSVAWEESLRMDQMRASSWMHSSPQRAASPAQTDLGAWVGTVRSAGMGDAYTTPTRPTTANAGGTPWLPHNARATLVHARVGEAGVASPLPAAGGTSAAATKFQWGEVSGTNYNMMTPGITSKLTRRMDDLNEAVKKAKVEQPLTPYVLSSCTCSGEDWSACPVHGPPGTWTCARIGPQARAGTTPGQDDGSSGTSIVSDVCSTPRAEPLPDLSLDDAPPEGTSLLERFELSAARSPRSPPEQRDRPVRRKTAPRRAPGSGIKRTRVSSRAVDPSPPVASAGGGALMDVVIRVDAEWRKHNGFQVWQVFERGEGGEPLRAKELVPLESLGDQRKGWFRFAATKFSKVQSVAGKGGKSGWGKDTYASADCTVAEHAVGKRVLNLVSLNQEQKQVKGLHDNLALTLKTLR